MAEKGVQLDSIDEKEVSTHDNEQQQQQEEEAVSISVAPQANKNRITPNLARRELIAGLRSNYLKFGLPLYEASIKCNWKAAKAILDEKPELVRYSITENGETALHVAAYSTADPKDVEEFVENLVGMMTEEDLTLENESFSTAFYLAATSGNLTTVKIMVEKNKTLLTIPGTFGMLPLYAAALYGHHELVKYMYENSSELCDDGCNNQKHDWLLEKCVEGDMFDVALKIVTKYPELGHSRVLQILAGKTDVFSVKESNSVKRSIKSALRYIGLTVGASEKETEALQLLKLIWEDIANKHKKDIDAILRGPLDPIEKLEMENPENFVQALQLQKLAIKYLDKLEMETDNIIRGPTNLIQKDIESASGELDQALQLGILITEYIDNMHVQIQNFNSKYSNPVSGKRDRALELHNFISKHIVSMHVETQRILERTFQKETKSKELQQLIGRNIRSMRAQTKLRETYSNRVLFIAAEMGNTRFLVELIRRYPDLSWKIDDNNQSIFHIAVKNRHEGIYNLLYEMGSMKDFVTPIKDANENTMLHLVGKMPTKKALEDVSGPALQMQRELLWFKEVRNMILPSYRERKNKDGLTPRELFSEEHKELIKEGEKWLKETASQCMVVAALIATIVFAAAFTVPGGYDQNNGIPLFYHKATFVAFVVADAMSLFLSSTSILTFLSILTSRFAERDFVESLPQKLVLGILTLFLSITTMMITFSVSFFILYHKEMKWIPILIAAVAVMPVVLYVVLQFHVLTDVVRSIYISKYLFKPKRQLLFYENPKV